MFEDIKKRIVSRKLWAALLGSLLPHLASVLTGAVSAEDAMTASSAIVIAYIIGQSGVDAMAAK